MITLAVHWKTATRPPVKKALNPCRMEIKCHQNSLFFIGWEIKVPWRKKGVKRNNNFLVVKEGNFYFVLIKCRLRMFIHLIGFLFFIALLTDDLSFYMNRVARCLEPWQIQSAFVLKFQPGMHIDIVAGIFHIVISIRLLVNSLRLEKDISHAVFCVVRKDFIAPEAAFYLNKNTGPIGNLGKAAVDQMKLMAFYFMLV